MAKDVYWFKHECDSVLNPQLRRLQHIHTHWGKGVYWDVIEILRGCEGYKGDCDEVGLLMFASMIGVSDPTKFTNWFNDCLAFGLFVKDENKFYSPMLVENMRFWDAKKVAGSQGGRGNKKANQKQNESKTKANAKLNKADLDFAKSNNRIEQNRIEDNKYNQFMSGFNSVTGKSFRGGKKTEASLRVRLNEGFTLEQILAATKNCFNNSYHKENPHHLTPDFILRVDKLEKYLNNTPTEQPQPIDPKKAPSYDFFGVDSKPIQNV